MITTGRLCDSCDAEVFWVRFPSGKAMLVDAQPRSDGNVEVLETDGGLRVRVLRAVEPSVTGLRYGSHFATCPKADEHRKRGKR